MIFDSVNCLENYAPVHPRFEGAFEFAKELIAKNPAPGKYEMPGDEKGVFVNVTEYEAKPEEAGVSEVHGQYIDVQIMLAGSERIYLPRRESGAEKTPYSRENDCAIYELPDLGTCQRLPLDAGTFAIFFPGEQHAPGLVPSSQKDRHVRKAIIKVLL